MTATGKFSESNFNLKELLKTDPMTSEFQHRMSNFLGSTGGIFNHLLEDYIKKYGLDITKPNNSKGIVNARNFKLCAKHFDNKDAKKFISWYNTELDKIKHDKEFGFLVDKLHDNVHKDSTTSIQLNFHQDVKIDNKKITYIPIDIQNAKKTFVENPKKEMKEICISFLERIREMLIFAKENF